MIASALARAYRHPLADLVMPVEDDVERRDVVLFFAFLNGEETSVGKNAPLALIHAKLLQVVRRSGRRIVRIEGLSELTEGPYQTHAPAPRTESSANGRNSRRCPELHSAY